MAQRQDIYELFLQSKGVCTDSRKDCCDMLFFALSGTNFDGNKYALKALANGASFAIVDDLKLANEERCIVVSDTLKSLQNLARRYRQSFDIPVLAITGSNGKTTTKELALNVLQKKFKVHATAGNFNNLIGLPLTILKAPKDTEFMVLEIGSNALGEIKALSDIAEPNYGLITNVGEAHLEGFGDIGGVFMEKTALYEHVVVQPEGHIFVPGDDELLNDRYGRHEKANTYFIGDVLDASERKLGVKFTALLPNIKGVFRVQDEIYNVESALMGKHNAQNICAAIALGRYFGVDSNQIAGGISAYQPTNNRSQLIKTQTGEIILDAYNANVSSMMAALDLFDQIESSVKAIFLGDMKEMGSSEEKVHTSVLRKVEQLRYPAKAYFVGTVFDSLLPNYELCYSTTDELIADRKSEIIEVLNSHHSLIKGSRSIGLEKLVDLL